MSYPTAWLLHHKINRAMAARESCHRPGGAVQVDDAYLGERASERQTRARLARTRCRWWPPCLSTTGAGHGFCKLNPVSGFALDAIGQ